MKRMYQFAIAIAIMFALIVSSSQIAFAQKHKVNVKDGPLKEKDWLAEAPGAQLGENHSDVKTWISLWYGPEGNYENNGTFQVSSKRDLIDEGTKGKLTEPKLSTVEGLKLTQTVKMAWDKKHGGTREWTVFELDVASQDNMNRDGPADNIDTYVMCVIDAPKDMKSIFSPAHDDHAQIWVNGDKWYNDSTWTGGAQIVHYNIEVQLTKGANVVLYRVGESGGAAYINMHFDDNTHKVCKIYPDKAKDQKSFFNEVRGVLPVDPTGKATATWADIKQNH
ncbi:MAG: hypothetical protein OXD49_13205 [Candidatus Poribacteria bacterium]|nr:hypothetical protein [Candidatus Poribacteria bacterium]